MNARRKYRIFLCFLLALSLLGLGFGSWAALRDWIPDHLTVEERGETPGLFPYPVSLFVTGRVADPDSESRAEGAKFGSGEARQAEDSGVTNEKEKWNGAGEESHGNGESGPAGTGQAEKNREAIQAVDQGGVYQTDSGSQALRGSESLPAADYSIEYSLFGKIPLKTVSATVAEPQELYAGGMPIGIYLQTDGVLVVGTGTITGADGKSCCPAENIVKSGDYIKSVNGQSLSTKEELVECVSSSGGADLILQVERDGEEIQVKIHPVQDENGSYRAGIWVRNDTQGIGTLTYVDQEGRFGALGHGISDVDTGTLMEITDGTLYNADVVSIVKGQQGTPGELSGVIHYSEGYKIGIIEENCANGIYGTISGFPLLADNLTKYETAYRQSVKTGPAAILCSIGGERKEYQVEIEEIRLNGKDVNKGMVLCVTDPELLELTGGIVQGMSGSPIIQNGRIIGAVTHVFVNDPTKGYGIFIENMLEH